MPQKEEQKFKVKIETPAKDLPADSVILSLTGMTETQFVEDIIQNRGGKWDFLFT